MSRRGKPQAGYVYLAHFSTNLSHARHYLGFATDLGQRIAQHRAGTGARLMEVVKQAGIGWKLVRVWPGDRGLERRLKRRKNTPRRLCPGTWVRFPVTTGKPGCSVHPAANSRTGGRFWRAACIRCYG